MEDGMLIEELRLDGNAAGGVLRDVFAFEATAARATCAGCGDTRPIGALLAYGHTMGVVLRCPGCDAVMLRLTRIPGQLRMDASGIELLVVSDESVAS
jgi:hypothetical protein